MMQWMSILVASSGLARVCALCCGLRFAASGPQICAVILPDTDERPLISF
jgi:hypothetical protein